MMQFGSLTRLRGWLAGLMVLTPLSAIWAQNAAATVASPNQTTQQTAAATTTTSPAPVAAPADPLLDQIDKAIEVNSHRYLRANYNSPWQIFHGIVAYRQGFTLQVGDKRMPAIDWIATADARYHNLPWIVVTPHGAKFHPYSGVPKAFEGHQFQSLALLSESHLPTDFKFKVGTRDVTIADMLQTTMMEFNPREETTWVLWALINYMPVDKQWVSQSGESWSIERLVQLEVAAHTPTRPCGGNHNLFVLCRARDKYLKTGLPLRGVWLEADQKIKMYTEYARTMQNRDGSFSSDFYKGPGHTTDMNSRFNTTGHTMEFLSIGLPEQRLKEQWVRNAVNILSWELIQTKQASPDPGPLYHSLNALMNYRTRVRPPAAPTEVAQVPATAAVTPTVPGTVKTETPAAAPALLAP
ncbi:MAG: hypothetical protein SH850_02430, partial [Planctomycetaceae bacterium]|nr:hypothetical protein [Planctomycetaceae bacterium]